MKIVQSFQNLIPEAVRDELVVVPKRSIQLAFASISILALGIGIALGMFILGSPLGAFAMAGCYMVSMVLGRMITKHETKVLNRVENRDKGEVV